MDGIYRPRHGVTATSHAERLRVDAQRADLAVLVLAATDELEASRELYRRLLAAGALSFPLAVAA